MSRFKYIGPDYKTAISIHGVNMRPKDIPEEKLPYYFTRYPSLKKLFKEEETKVSSKKKDIVTN